MSIREIHLAHELSHELSKAETLRTESPVLTHSPTAGWPRLLISLAAQTLGGAPFFAHFAKGGNHEHVRNRV